MDQRRFEVLGVGILFACSGAVFIFATRDVAPAWMVLGLVLVLIGFACALVSLFGLPEAIRGWRPGRDARGRDPDDGEDHEASG